MEKFYLKKDRLFDFFDCISKDYFLYVPIKIENLEDYILKDYSSVKKEDIDYNPYRTIEPLKSFLMYPKERISIYFGEILSPKNKKVAIFGVKNCDLFSLKIQDFVFLEGGEIDPLYKEKRKDLLIISSDCLSFKEVCFCLTYDINPYPKEGFDLNFSSLNEGFLVEVGSEKGKDTLESIKSLLESINTAQIKELTLKRELLIKELREHLESYSIPSKDILKEIVRKGYTSDIWSEEMLSCVECGGCNFICPTCHCFLLSDERYGVVNERIRIWDSCQYANFAKVAGGANPLNTRTKRLRNRFLKKFDFFIDNLGIQACCGCGRCIEVCPGKIDIREILKELKMQNEKLKIA